MAIRENDSDVTFRPRFWDDPIYFQLERFEPSCVGIYCHCFLFERTAISDVDVKDTVKPWISKMERTVNTCNKTLNDDMVQLNELRRSERQFSKNSNLLKRHAVECDDDLLDIVHALRNLKHAWDKLYDKLENPVLKYYMLKNILMSDIEHCFFLNWWSYRLKKIHHLKDKIKVFTSLHEEIHKQSDSLHRCFLRQGMQAVYDELDILQFLNEGILSEPIKEMLRMTEKSLMLNDRRAVVEILEGKQRQNCSSLRRKVLREVLLTSMDFLDLCLPDKGHFSVHIEVGTTFETLSTPSVCATETVFCLVAENSSTGTQFWNFQLPSKIIEGGHCFAGRFHRLNYNKALAAVLVTLVWCLRCTHTCRAMDVDAKADHLSQLFLSGNNTHAFEEDCDFDIYLPHKEQENDISSWFGDNTDVWICNNKCRIICSSVQFLSQDGVKYLKIEDGCHPFTQKETSLENFYKQWTGIGYYIKCRHEQQKENKTHTFGEDCDFDICPLHIEQKSDKSRGFDGKTDVLICTNINRIMCLHVSARCLLQDEIKDVNIESYRQLMIRLEKHSHKVFYKQWTGKCYYICRHEHQNIVDDHKRVFVVLIENKTDTFEVDCDVDIYCLHKEQESGLKSWLERNTDIWICTNKSGTVCSPARFLLQGFRDVGDEILQEYSQNQPKRLLEMTNRTVQVISLKPNNDERIMHTEEKMKMPESTDEFNTKIIVLLAIIAYLIVLCALMSIINVKSPNPTDRIIGKRYPRATPDLAWFRGNSKPKEDHRYRSIKVQKKAACQRKPVQEQTKTPETKPTVLTDTECSETSEKFYSLAEKYVTPLPSVDVSFEESNEILITTQSIEADPNLKFVYDEHCEIEIRKFTEIKGIRKTLHTQDEQTSNFHANKELVKNKSIPKVIDAYTNLSSAIKDGDETFYDLKWNKKITLKVNPKIPLEKSFDLPDNTAIIEDAVRPTAKFVDDVDFDKLSADKENPRRRRKRVDNTFSEKEFDQIRLLRDLTWLPLNQLPVPKVDLIVGFVPDFPPLMAIIDQIAIGKPPAPHVSMRYELLRFCTLRSYPRDDKPYLIKLAEAGFYYASDGDGVVCYCCGIRRYNWTADDNPLKIHKRINPTCKYLTKNEEVNVRNDFNGPFSKSLLYIDNILEPKESQEPSEDINNDWAPERTRGPAPRPQSSQNAQSSSQLGINTAIPKHSQYATKPARIASFNGWPDSASHSPDELADAGFFYAGFGDCVRCFYCGIGLRHWTQDDNPWIEHARWAKNCVFVKQKKGDEFVNLVQLAVQYSQDNSSPENAAANQISPREIENYLLSDASQSVLEMGYQPRIIKKAIENILRQNRQTEITAQFLMEQVLALEEAGNSTQAAPTPGSPAAPVAYVGPSEGALASAPKESSNEKRNDKESKNITHKPVAEEKKKEEKKTSKETKGKDKETGSNDPSAQDPKVIKAENEQLKEQTLCKICLDQTVCIVFLPCGHLVTCADCAPAMRKCPICRALVQGTVRTYMS